MKAIWLTTLAGLALAAAAPAWATPQHDAEATVRTFYKALHDRDEAAVIGLLSSKGMTEYPSAGTSLKTVDAASIHAVLAAGTIVDVDLKEVGVELLSPTVALVTGYREGVIAIGKAPAVPAKRRMSILLVLEGGTWRFAHAHFSAVG